MNMDNLKLIQTENYLLLVDETVFPGCNDYYLKDGRVKRRDSSRNWTHADCSIIVAHLPLNNAPVLEGVLLLPEAINDKKLKRLAEGKIPKGLSNRRAIKHGFKIGYREAFQNKWSDEDMQNCWNAAREGNYITAPFVQFVHKYLTYEQYSKSLLLLPTGFEPEYEIVPDPNNYGTGQIFHNNRKEQFKTIKTDTGEFLCGKYIYEKL